MHWVRVSRLLKVPRKSLVPQGGREKALGLPGPNKPPASQRCPQSPRSYAKQPTPPGWRDHEKDAATQTGPTASSKVSRGAMLPPSGSLGNRPGCGALRAL